MPTLGNKTNAEGTAVTAARAHHSEDDSFEKLRFARESIAKEVDYRRDKQWRIFSWTTTLLLGSIAGMVTISGDKGFYLSWPLRVAASCAILTITAYACLWLDQNLADERKAMKALKCCDERLNITHITSPELGPRRFGYAETLVLLAIAAVCAVIFAPHHDRDPTALRKRETPNTVGPADG